MAWNPITSAIDALMQFLARLWQGWKDVLGTLWDFALKGYTWLVGLFWIAVCAIVGLVDSVKVMIDGLIESLATLVMPDPHATQAVTHYLEVANTFFPVEEGFAILLGLCTVWGVALLYRFVKSWIPTLD